MNSTHQPTTQANPQTWILASNNQGKLAEFERLFTQNQLNIQLIPQKQLGIKDAIENAPTFVENALIKARHASRLAKMPAIADDSGLCVPVLLGKPGIYSARFAGKHGDDHANNAKLLAELQIHRQPNHPILAQFVCVLAMVRHADDPLPILAQGIWHGEILPSPQGENGFGYDPLFWLPDLQKSSAELTPEEKNRLSHRAQALKILMQALKTQI